MEELATSSETTVLLRMADSHIDHVSNPHLHGAVLTLRATSKPAHQITSRVICFTSLTVSLTSRFTADVFNIRCIVLLGFRGESRWIASPYTLQRHLCVL